jgi:catechol 2,3-dioxygenase-like lactoylglutathione lyase family enzyme
MERRQEAGTGTHGAAPDGVAMHPRRAEAPLALVRGLAQLHFVRRDTRRTRAFLEDFGLRVHESRTGGLTFRGTWEGAPCVVVDEGPEDRFAGSTFVVDGPAEVARLGERLDRPVEAHMGGVAVSLVDPAGVPVRVAADLDTLDALPERAPLSFNFGERAARRNASQRPPRAPAEVQRLGHVVLETTRFQAMLTWYLETLGLIVSDFLYLDDLPQRGPVMAFLRCDRGDVPTDHHTVALHLGMENGLSHAAFQVTDLDAIAAGGEHLAQQGHRRVWGIGRHILGSQIFDYWRGPAGDLFEHYADGDVFDASVEPGWEPMRASGLSQWGPPVNGDFLGNQIRPSLVAKALRALADRHNDIDLAAARGLIKAMES